MFEVFKSENDHQFHWRLKAANNKTVAQSEAYTTKDACIEGMEAVRTAAKDDQFIDLTMMPQMDVPGLCVALRGLT